MAYPSHYNRVEKLSLWLGDKPLHLTVAFCGLLAFAINFSVMFVTYLLLDGTTIVRTALLSLIVALYTSALLALIFGLAIPRMRSRLDRVFGTTLTARDRADVSAWVRTGVMPQNEALKPGLVAYLDYIEPIASGKNIMSLRSKGARIGLFVFYAVALAFFLALLVIDPQSRTRWYVYLDIVLFGYFVYVLNPWSRKPRRLFGILNRRSLDRITARRHELAVR